MRPKCFLYGCYSFPLSLFIWLCSHSSSGSILEPKFSTLKGMENGQWRSLWGIMDGSVMFWLICYIPVTNISLYPYFLGPRKYNLCAKIYLFNYLFIYLFFFPAVDFVDWTWPEISDTTSRISITWSRCKWICYLLNLVL